MSGETTTKSRRQSQAETRAKLIKSAERLMIAHSIPALSVRQLCADANNHVMILSGLSREKVNQAFGGVPNLSLACEHGFHYRVKNGPWEQLLPGVDTSWREVAEAIMHVLEPAFLITLLRMCRTLRTSSTEP